MYLLLSNDGEGAAWSWFLLGGLVEVQGDNYDISNFASMTWIPIFPCGDIKAEMICCRHRMTFLGLLSALLWLDLAMMKD